jgi:hypothetical protein
MRLVKRFRDDIHDGENLETAKLYMDILDNYAETKKALQPLANEFCMKYKGYSLN